MTFISPNDRVAGINALVQVFAYMAKFPEVDIKEQSEASIRKEAEDSWDRATVVERETMLGIWQSCCVPGSYYECHMTFEPDKVAAATKTLTHEILEDIGVEYHFTFSEIEGDEQMGPGTKWYLTRSKTDGASLANDMNALTIALGSAGIPILRRKIEHIVFDERRDQIAGTARAA